MRCKIERKDIGDDVEEGVLQYEVNFGWVHNGLGGWHTIKGTRLLRVNGVFCLIGGPPTGVPDVPTLPTIEQRIPLILGAGGVPTLPMRYVASLLERKDVE